jgi:hypothetical protein
MGKPLAYFSHIGKNIKPEGRLCRDIISFRNNESSYCGIPHIFTIISTELIHFDVLVLQMYGGKITYIVYI